MTSRGQPAASPPVPAWTTAAVARRLGVSPATLRSWSARHGIGPPDHEAGRYRRYTDADLAELETVLRLRRDGMAMATAVAIARARRAGSGPASGEPDAGGAGRQADPTPDVRPGSAPHDADLPADLASVVAAVRALDADSAVSTLQASLTRRGVVSTWNRLCRPALADTTITLPVPAPPEAPIPAAAPGPDLESEAAGPVDAECTLTWAITTSLRRVSPPPPAPDAPGLLLACAHGELHTLALDALLAALHQLQLPARMLGPSVPTPALRHAGARTRPAAVFVWAQVTQTARPATLQGLDAHTGTVVAAGPGWDPAGLPRHVRTARSLDEALALAERAGSPRR